MAFGRLTKASVWSIKITAKQNLSDKDRDFIVDLVSEEARKAVTKYSFILHNVIESKNYSEIFAEGPWVAIKNLLSVIEGNLTYKKLLYAKV